jgi:hypothetical protein
VVTAQRYWWILLLILIAPSVHAIAYTTTVTPIQNEIFRNESATYEVTINNFDDAEGEFQVYTIDTAWTTKTQPLDLSVPAHAAKTFTLSLRPTTEAGFGTQGVTVNFKELNSGTVTKRTLVLSLRDPANTRGYAPNVGLDINMPYDIDPRTAVPLRVVLLNRNQLNITGLTILITSPHFSTTTTMNLGPLSERTKEVTGIAIDPRTPPGEDEVVVQLVYNDRVINQLAKNYRIKEYTQIKQKVGESNFFFKTEKKIEISNDGNVKNTAVVTVPTSLVKSLFVSSSLPYESEVRENQRVLVWNVPLDPDGAKTFTYTENYRILVLLVLLAIIGSVAYFLLRSPVVAVKEAVAIAHADGVSDIKVRVFVKNRSAKIMQGIQVTDRVPSLADVIKHEAPGSLSPTKVAVSEKQGTLLRWDLEVLEPFEERILTYQVKSKLKIIGRMKLPNAKIRYTSQGKERVVYSNNIELVERFKDR